MKPNIDAICNEDSLCANCEFNAATRKFYDEDVCPKCFRELRNEQQGRNNDQEDEEDLL